MGDTLCLHLCLDETRNWISIYSNELQCANNVKMMNSTQQLKTIQCCSAKESIVHAHGWLLAQRRVHIMSQMLKVLIEEHKEKLTSDTNAGRGKKKVTHPVTTLCVVSSLTAQLSLDIVCVEKEFNSQDENQKAARKQ